MLKMKGIRVQIKKHFVNYEGGLLKDRGYGICKKTFFGRSVAEDRYSRRKVS
jgi:hypothetical protein